MSETIRTWPLSVSFCIGLGPVIGFLPTLARQLGYSFTTYGVMMTIISLSSTAWTLLVGVLVDKFRVKKILFIAFLLGMGVTSTVFVFVPKVPLDAVVELKCLSETVLTAIHAEDGGPQTSSGQSNDIADKLMSCTVSSPSTNFPVSNAGDLNSSGQYG